MDDGPRPLKVPRVVVVGAGIGGLVSALLLARRGLAVTLVEAGPAPGGKMRHLMVGDAPIDAGPTVFTMRWIFDQIFEEAGTRLESCLRIAPLGTLARHAWRDGARLDLFADLAASADAIGTFAGAAEARRFTAFCAQARTVYRTLEGPYIRSSRPTLAQLTVDLGVSGLAQLAGLGPFASLWRSLGRSFHDPRMRQLFGRYATYCGASPWLAPATLMLVAQVELDGVWIVDGGMHAVARAFADLAARRGVVLRYGRACREILVRDGRACGVRLADGEVLAADIVVYNGDVGALADGRLGEGVRTAVDAVPLEARSLSAVTWAVNAPAPAFPLVRHNVFFDDDYRSEFEDIFTARRLPRQATVYVCAQDRDDSATAPAGGAPERLLCLVNAPATGDRAAGQPGHLDDEEIARCERRAQDLLQANGLSTDLSAPTVRRTAPADFERLFPGSGGALYGRATHGWMALFRRPGSASRLPGLYLAGGSVHPGPGVPMAAMSGRLAAATVMAHLDSTSRSRRVVISGGTSTRSATTAAAD